jgi:hypothetical protein
MSNRVSLRQKRSSIEIIRHLRVFLEIFPAINPQEMTSELKSKIRDNIHLYRDSVRAQILHEISNVSETLIPVV